MKHTVIIALLVTVLLAVLIVSYFNEPIFPKITENFYVLILISLLNILVVFLTVGYIRRKMHKVNPQEYSLDQKLILYLKCYNFQSLLISVIILIDGIAYGLLHNNVYFIEALAMMIFLSSNYPSPGKFEKEGNLARDERHRINS